MLLANKIHTNSVVPDSTDINLILTGEIALVIAIAHSLMKTSSIVSITIACSLIGNKTIYETAAYVTHTSSATDFAGLTDLFN